MLHALKLDEGWEWACEHPESRWHERRMIDSNCPRCVIGARAAVRRGEIVGVTEHDRETGDPVKVWPDFETYLAHVQERENA